MTIRTFEDACRFLYPRTTGGIKWGLDTTRALLAELGEPHRHFPVVHIGGTNGKGSTATFVASMLRAAGLRVGLYTSPHLVSLLERSTVNGQPATGDAFTAWVRRLEPLAVKLDASFFEITTAAAFADLAARGAEISVIEVGLGGRLDSTNVVEPLACGVTRIALEHTDYLGTDLKGIAREKAGIAKPGAPFRTTETDPALVDAIREECEVRGASCGLVDPGAAAGYALGLRGLHQVANASLAVALVESLAAPWRPDEEAIRAGLAGARLAGRFDRRGRWLFDVAHNPDGVRALVAALEAEPVPRPLTAVVAVLRDKDWMTMLKLLAPAVDGIVLTVAPSAPEGRAWDPNTAGGSLEEGGGRVVVEPDLETALRVAGGRSRTVLVSGSFHTVGDAMQLLSVDPLC